MSGEIIISIIDKEYFKVLNGPLEVKSKKINDQIENPNVDVVFNNGSNSVASAFCSVLTVLEKLYPELKSICDKLKVSTEAGYMGYIEPEDSKKIFDCIKDHTQESFGKIYNGKVDGENDKMWYAHQELFIVLKDALKESVEKDRVFFLVLNLH